MADLTREDIVGVLKPAEDTVVAQILAIGATKQDLRRPSPGRRMTRL